MIISYSTSTACNKNLRSVFLKDGKSKAISEPTPNPVIDQICGRPIENGENVYCCNLDEFKELFEQFNKAKNKLIRTRARIKNFFDYYRNLDMVEEKKMVNIIKNQPSVKKCIGDSYSVVTVDLNRRTLLMMLSTVQEFFDWKIEQLSSIPCLVCSPLHENYTFLGPVDLTLYVNMTQCSADFQKFGNLDNLAYYLVHMLTLIKGIKCAQGYSISYELQNLPDLSKWSKITDLRNHCLDPRHNPYNDPNCAESFQGVSNMMLFPQFEKLNFMSEFALEAFKNFYGPQVKLVMEQERVNSLTPDETRLLTNETPKQQAVWDFHSFNMYNPEQKWPIRLNVSCTYTGLRWPKYAMNKERVSGFTKVLNDSIEAELKKQKEMLVGKENQYEASFLVEDDLREGVLLRNAFVMMSLLILIMGFKC
jgi:hypothetical protein